MAACAPIACGAVPRIKKKLGRDEVEDIARKTHLSEAEVKALYARYRRLAPSGKLLPEQFKQTMGVLGLTDDSFLPDRMFHIFDVNEDGALDFREFASSLAVMIRGTEDEKLQLSFEMAAGNRGAEGIKLEDFQRLVSACNTMMSSLVEPARSETSSEDAMKLFHDLASGGSSGDESDAVISLDAYKKAAQSSDEFLACLGLDPHGGRKARTGVPVSYGTGSHATPSAEPPAVAASQDHVLVPVAQIEELRSRIAALRAAATQHRTQRPSAMQGATSASWEEADERWWTPICDCTTAQRRTEMQSEVSLPRRNPFDEVCRELDGIIGWCARCNKAANPGIDAALSEPAVHQQHYCSPSSTASSGGRLPHAAAVPKDGLGEPIVHRQSSREFAEAGLPTRPQVHGRPNSTRSHSKQPCGAYVRPRTSTLGTSSSTRHRKQHRLLGPKKGLAVHFGHENWNMVLSMMIGIRMSVGRSMHEISRELQPVDFIMKEKFSIIPRIANIFDSAVSKRVTMTRFMDYAPMVFQRIRSRFGIHHDEYLRSVGPEQLLGNMVLGNLSSLSELSSEGKSGAFFYYTADGKYMIKTVSPKEHKLLKGILKRYYDHITTQPGTLLVRFLGLHSLRVHKERKAGACGCGKTWNQSQRKLYFIVMGNMFNAPVEIHRRYDLKGSWVGRKTPPENFNDRTVALKDVDFKDANETIRVGDDRRTRLMAQIERDSTFLRDNNIIDYSLLLGICDLGANSIPPADGSAGDETGSETASERHHTSEAMGHVASERVMSNPSSPNSAQLQLEHFDDALHRRDMGGLLSSDKKSLYFVGIIDILTPYDSVKKLEHVFKAIRYNSRGVSCCPPKHYAERFNEFLRRSVV